MITKKNVYTVFLILILTITTEKNVVAVELDGKAYGHSVTQAQKAALRRLGVLLFEDIRKKLCERKNNNDWATICRPSFYATSLPLLGVNYTKLTAKTSISTGRKELIGRQAIISTESLPCYTKILAILRNKILTRGKINSAKKDSLSEYLLLQQYIDVNRYESHRAVADYLGDKSYDSLATYIPDFNSFNSVFKHTSNDIPALVRLVAQWVDKNIPTVQQKNNLYFYPLLVGSYNQITEFSAIVQKALNVNIQTTNDQNFGTYTISSHYNLMGKQDILLTLQLIENNKDILDAVNIRLKQATYLGIDTQPKAEKLELQLEDTSIRVSEFISKLSTTDGIQNLLFHSREKIILQVKMNKPGNYFIIGHVKKAAEEYSYIVTIGSDTSPFINTISPSEINSWVTIGKFSVEAPYGREHLQLVASTSDLSKLLPKHHKDTNGYNAVNNSPNNLQKSITQLRQQLKHAQDPLRGLERINKQTIKTGQQSAQIHESILMFTTTDKDCRSVRGLKPDCIVSENFGAETKKPQFAYYDINRSRGLERNCKVNSLTVSK